MKRLGFSHEDAVRAVMLGPNFIDTSSAKGGIAEDEDLPVLQGSTDLRQDARSLRQERIGELQGDTLEAMASDPLADPFRRHLWASKGCVAPRAAHERPF